MDVIERKQTPMVATRQTNAIPAKLAWLMDCYRCGHRHIETVARQLSEPCLRELTHQQAQMFASFIEQLAPWANQSHAIPLHQVRVFTGRPSRNDDDVLLRLYLWTLEGIERAIQHATDPGESEELVMLLGYHYDRVCWWRQRMMGELDRLGIELKGPILARLRCGDPRRRDDSKGFNSHWKLKRKEVATGESTAGQEGEARRLERRRWITGSEFERSSDHATQHTHRIVGHRGRRIWSDDSDPGPVRGGNGQNR